LLSALRDECQNEHVFRNLARVRAVARTAALPSNENLDANAQRAHSPSLTRSGPSPDAKAGEAPASPSDVRDWNAIDKNHDDLISSEEMEAYLKEGATHTSMSSQVRSSGRAVRN
jgi:predicted Zn-dependent protease